MWRRYLERRTTVHVSSWKVLMASLSCATRTQEWLPTQCMWRDGKDYTHMVVCMDKICNEGNLRKEGRVFWLILWGYRMKPVRSRREDIVAWGRRTHGTCSQEAKNNRWLNAARSHLSVQSRTLACGNVPPHSAESSGLNLPNLDDHFTNKPRSLPPRWL